MLDKKEVEKICKRFQYVDGILASHGYGTKENPLPFMVSVRDYPKFITQICKLQPKNQVVIAKTKIIESLGSYDFLGCSLKDTIWTEKLKKYKSKKVKIILEFNYDNENKKI